MHTTDIFQILLGTPLACIYYYSHFSYHCHIVSPPGIWTNSARKTITSVHVPSKCNEWLQWNLNFQDTCNKTSSWSMQKVCFEISAQNKIPTSNINSSEYSSYVNFFYRLLKLIFSIISAIQTVLNDSESSPIKVIMCFLRT